MTGDEKVGNKGAIVYLAQCSNDHSKVYVGKTVRTLDERRRQHELDARKGTNRPFLNELVQEGFKNWIWTPLASFSTEQEALDWERDLIRKFDLPSVEVLNVSHTKSLSQERLKALSEECGVNLLLGATEKRHSYGKGSRTLSPLAKARKTAAAKRGAKTAWTRPESLMWMRRSGKLKPIIDLDTQKIYFSISEAKEKLGHSYHCVKRACDTGKPTPSGSRLAWQDLDGKPILKNGHLKKLSRKKRVKNLVSGDIFNSASEAAKACGISYSMVQGVCCGAYQTCGGTSFCYLNDEGEEEFTEAHQNFLKKLERERTFGYVAYHTDDKHLTKPMIFENKRELCNTLKIDPMHVEDVCRGTRQHVTRYRIAYYDKIKKVPILEKAHLEPIKKQFRRVICLDDHVLFDSQGEAAKYHGLDPNQVLLCCKGLLKSTGRNIGQPRHFAFVDDRENPILTAKHREPPGKATVRFFCPELRKEFISVTAFARETGVPAARARKHLNDPKVDLGEYHLIRLPDRAPEPEGW